MRLSLPGLVALIALATTKTYAQESAVSNGQAAAPVAPGTKKEEKSKEQDQEDKDKGEDEDEEKGKDEDETKEEDKKDAKGKRKRSGEDHKPDHKIPKGGPYKLPGETGTFLRSPYLQCATPSSIQIVWRTLKPLENPAIHFGTAAGVLDKRNERSAIKLRRLADEGEKERPLHSAPFGTHQYETLITGLPSDTKFFYAVFDGVQRLTREDDTCFFRTLPPLGTSRDCLFWIVGDSGTGQRAPKAVHRAMRQWLAINSLELDLYTHVGDMAYNDGKDIEFTDTFFKIYDDTLRHTVCFPAFGNHEGHSSNGNSQIGPYFDAYVCPSTGQSGGEPSGTEAYYSYDFGRVHFISLNSHDADRRANASMARWLKEDLDRVRPEKTDWVLAYWHHPPYTKGSHDSDKETQLKEMRQYIIPILDSHGVDLAFCGHSHIYERSMLIEGAHATPTTPYKDPVSNRYVVIDDGDGNPDRDGAYRKSKGINAREGTIHMVSGHGGTKNVARFGGASPVMKKVSIEHGSVLVQIKGNTLTATMLTYQGKEFDTFQIVKEGKIIPRRVENPAIIPQTLAIMGVQEPLPVHAIPIISPQSDWRYLAGSDPKSDNWTRSSFDDNSWKLGRGGFGYGYPTNRTELFGMRNEYQRVYLRKAFALEDTHDIEKAGLAINFDDGFIAYLNGEEVVRYNISGGSRGDVGDIKRVDKNEPRFFSLAAHKGKFRLGKNVLAIEGHNDAKGSSDFTLDPWLLIRN
ncbi:MAG: metallophosphoesterase [Verrucomicrobiales bacterium]